MADQSKYILFLFFRKSKVLKVYRGEFHLSMQCRLLSQKLKMRTFYLSLSHMTCARVHTYIHTKHISPETFLSESDVGVA